jgi:UDP-3-O-[3-hydroxymyristoyl] glucosamine N-acyltransferase
MIDNLVQIGHNVTLGRGCVIAGLTAIGGSTSVGDFVMIGGGAALAGHLTIGAGARIAGKSGVMRDVPAGGAVSGSPAVPIKQFFRQAAILARLAAGKEE